MIASNTKEVNLVLLLISVGKRLEPNEARETWQAFEMELASDVPKKYQDEAILSLRRCFGSLSSDGETRHNTRLIRQKTTNAIMQLFFGKTKVLV